MYVYLLGAGASCNALPLVKDFPKRLMERSERIPQLKRSLFDDKPLDSGNTPLQVLESFGKSLNWLATQCKNHSSVDTLAKKFFLTNKTDDLLRLKATLSCYLWIEQVLCQPDLRYDAFFAAIIDRAEYKIKLPDKLKIISWNYDSQIEKAFFSYWGEIRGLYNALQAYPVHSQREYKVDTTKFCVIRLNGIAGIHLNNYEKIGRFKNLFSISNQDEAVPTLVDMYDRYMNSPDDAYPLLDFSWDEDHYTSKYRPIAEKAVSSAKVIVIIGYSFPFFNRTTDKPLLNSMKELKKVFVQVSKEDFPGVKARIQSLVPHINDIVHIDNLEQFYIPHDF